MNIENSEPAPFTDNSLEYLLAVRNNIENAHAATSSDRKVLVAAHEADQAANAATAAKLKQRDDDDAAEIKAKGEAYRQSRLRDALRQAYTGTDAEFAAAFPSLLATFNEQETMRNMAERRENARRMTRHWA